MAKRKANARKTSTPAAPRKKAAKKKTTKKTKKSPVQAAPAAATTTPRKRSTKPKAANTAQIKPTWDQISARAFEIWQRKGRPLGQDEQNWREAEAELLAGK